DVFGGWSGVSAGVVVDEDEGGGAVANRGGEDLAGVDEGGGEGALGDADLGLHAVLAVEKEDVERLAVKLREAAAEVGPHGFGVADRRADAERNGLGT